MNIISDIVNDDNITSIVRENTKYISKHTNEITEIMNIIKTELTNLHYNLTESIDGIQIHLNDPYVSKDGDIVDNIITESIVKVIPDITTSKANYIIRVTNDSNNIYITKRN